MRVAEASELFDATVAFWRSWLGRSTYTAGGGRWSTVRRSR
jgi:hypothetical protein